MHQAAAAVTMGTHHRGNILLRCGQARSARRHFGTYRGRRGAGAPTQLVQLISGQNKLASECVESKSHLTVIFEWFNHFVVLVRRVE